MQVWSKWEINPAFSNISSSLTLTACNYMQTPCLGVGVKPLSSALLLSLSLKNLSPHDSQRQNKCLQVWQQVKAHGLLPHTLQTGTQFGAIFTAEYLQWNGFGITQTLNLQSTRGGSRLNRTNKTLVWKVHLLLLFLLGRFSRANCTTFPPSAPGTVHSLQVRRMQLTLASRARLLVQRWILELKEQQTAAKIQTLILLLHNVGDLSYPREAGVWRVPSKGLTGSWSTSNLVGFSSSTVVYTFSHLEKYCSFSVV